MTTRLQCVPQIQRAISMDGMLHGMGAVNVPMLAGSHQQTLKTAIDCIGIGLHSGRKVTMRLTPAAADHGIVFRRTDLGCDIPAQYAHVVDTRLATVLGDPADRDVRVSTVEHLMA